MQIIQAWVKHRILKTWTISSFSTWITKKKKKKGCPRRRHHGHPQTWAEIKRHKVNKIGFELFKMLRVVAETQETQSSATRAVVTIKNIAAQLKQCWHCWSGRNDIIKLTTFWCFEREDDRNTIKVYHNKIQLFPDCSHIKETNNDRNRLYYIAVELAMQMIAHLEVVKPAARTEVNYIIY